MRRERDEAELREQRQLLEPGGHVGPTSGGGVAETREDAEQDAVGERAQTVHAGFVVVGGFGAEVAPAAAAQACLRRLHRTKARHAPSSLARVQLLRLRLRLTGPTAKQRNMWGPHKIKNPVHEFLLK